jgi:hypothetical protein
LTPTIIIRCGGINTLRTARDGLDRMSAHVFPAGFFGLPLGKELNSLADNGSVAITAGTIEPLDQMFA